MRFDLYDAAAIVGLAMIGAGVTLISPPWALVVVGSIVMAWGVRASAAQSSRRGKDGG